MLPLCFLLIVLVATGSMVAGAIDLPTRLARWLMAWTVGCGQLILSVQLLSLGHRLDGVGLLVLNTAITAGVVVWRRFFSSRQASRVSFLHGRWKPSPWRIVAVGALLVVAIYVTIACASWPASDIYHFTMPLFWMEHASILPAAAYDPRLNGVVFASEAVALPGFVFVRTGVMFVLLAGVGAAGTLWIVGAIARLLGGSKIAAAGTAAVLVGVGPFANSVLSGKAEVTLSALWFAGSIYLLLEAYVRRSRCGVLFGCSALCFAMAAGTKNVVLLHLPLVAVFAWILFGFRELSQKMRAIVLGGLAGALASGWAWSYTSNRLWYGSWGGHPFLRETLSRQMDPASVWTRWTRGFVTAATDVIWLPTQWQTSFAAISQQAVAMLAGKKQLEEDDGFYGFDRSQIRPGLGLGLVGALVILPGIGVMIFAVLRREKTDAFWQRPRIALTVLALGSFLIYFTVLRWQSIGLFRLMLTCVVVVVPLGGLLFERKFARWFGLAVVGGSVALYSVWGLVFPLRRNEAFASSPPGRFLQKLQRNRTSDWEFRWSGQATEMRAIKENYSRREIYQAVLARIPHPTVFGVIGGPNAEVFGLFGDGFRNRVISINDCRAPGEVAASTDGVEFLVIEDFPLDRVNPGATTDFEPWLDVWENGNPIWRCLKRRSQ